MPFLDYLFDDEGPQPEAKMRGWLKKAKRTRSSFSSWNKRCVTPPLPLRPPPFPPPGRGSGPAVSSGARA